jgi:surfeit locus 1 family protein
LPTVPAPQGIVVVSGLAQVPTAKQFFLMPDHGDALPRLWSRLDLGRFAAERNETIQPVVILQAQGDATDALVRNWKPPEDRSAMHQSYAYQWFGMALALIIFYAVASLQRNKEHEQTST